jgi:hypothetical protein
MRNVLAIIGFVVVALVVGTCVACNDDNDEDAFGGVRIVELADHDCYEYGDCGGGQNYEDQWSNEDRNRNRNRNRGAFSPGPFDDSPVDAFNGNVVCLPGSTCYGDRRGDEPPPEEGPR